MSLPRPTGIKAPSRIGRPSGIPAPKTPAPASTAPPPTAAPTSALKAQSAIAKSARGVGFSPLHAEQYAEKTAPLLKGPEPLSEDGSNTDDFKIGDRIWVSGTKPGIIAFIGETQFAPGDWAGVVLDEPIGKNDGSVMGVRYFMCEAKRGVFSRLNKLTLTQQTPSRPPSQGHDSVSSDSKMSSTPNNPDIKLSLPTTNGTAATTSRPSSRLGMSASKNLSTSSSSLHKVSSAGTTPTGSGGTMPMRLPGTMPGGVKVGDRVFVSGSKPGILRYIGETDFAKGVWAGVELDEPLGKNDGAVAGKRYFDCKPLHGLFAPVHKISRAGSATSTPSPHSRPLMSTSLRSSRERSGSQESVSSLSSTASSVSRSRVRLGVTSLANQYTPRAIFQKEASKTGQRPSTLNLSATTAALQKALKEKEEHIEQLLRERDLERSEVARAAAHVDEAEGQLSSIKAEQDRLRLDAEEQIAKYRTMVADLENEKQELLAFLEEEKRKVEDLQFQLEEEALKDEGETKSVDPAIELKNKELERQLKKEKDRADNFEKELHQLKQSFEEQLKAVHAAEEAQTSYLDQIEELTYKLTQTEAKVKAFESSRLEDGAKTSQVSIELAEKSNKVKELEEQLALQRREMSSMSQQLNDVRDELHTSNDKRKKQEEYIQELSNKLKHVEDEHKLVMDELRNANSNSADLQRQLVASQAKAEELASDRSKLEKQLSELMKNSGDSSSQLASMNDQLMEKNRKIEDLLNDLSSSSQNLAKAKENYEVLQQEKDREIQEAKQNFEGIIAKLQDQVKELNETVEKSKAKTNQLVENLASEKKEALERKEAEIKNLQQEVLNIRDELSKQEDKTTAHKQLLDRVTAEKEAMQYEKQQAEKHLKRVEGEKAALSTELIQARVEATNLQELVNKSKGASVGLEDKVEKLTLEVEVMTKAKQEAEKSRDEAKQQKQEVAQERDLLQQELVQLRGDVQKRDIQLEETKKELDKIKLESTKKAEELMVKSQTETELLTHELGSLRISLQEAKDLAESKEFQLAELQAELDQLKTVVQERDLLRKEKSELLKEKEAVEEKQFIKEVDKHSTKVSELGSEMKTLQASEGLLKKEKTTLEKTIKQLQSDLQQTQHSLAEAQSKAASNASMISGDEVYQHLKDEADSAKGQVDFLNSVIVELQNKNQELQHRLSVMEDSGIHTNGEFTEPLETPSRSRAPPRLFCDICDVFDLHETEDCPKQAMSHSPEPTRHHGDPKSPRPYCEICEAFGHWTDQCDDEQMF
ncbi:CAP-Gly domain-containing linker protein 1-like isoform X2 [Physella acuta]|uniref:CAP-Gly domain-containing linker protein 1-like isoform X2 n=1 Tax=Physella acuta TaxID=109671 RepID=UPI0027DDFF74|nr:CAP-Gly domain-containing linker protein 1-like isoform X2 [Physella acuta]